MMPSFARASTPEVFGLGSVESAVGGASSARVGDFAAGHYNPAGLTRLRAPSLTLGVVGYGAQLKVSGEPSRGITDPVAIVIGAATPIPFAGALFDRLWFGLALTILPDTIVRVISHKPDAAFYPYYDNRTQRLVVLPSLAARLGAGVSLGIGFNYLAGLGGRVSAGEGATRAIEARVDEAIFSVLSVNFGARWQARPWLAVALVYRQQFSVPFVTISKNRVAGQPIDLDVDAEGLFAPHTLVAGGAVWLRRFVLSLDLSWAHWSAWNGPYVTVGGQLPLAGSIKSQPPRVEYRDTAAIRAGLEWTRDFSRATLAVRGGYGFESSPIPEEQREGTRLLDGHKHRLSAGLGVRIPLSRVTLALDGHAQMDLLHGSSVQGLGGARVVEGGGFAWAAGLQFGVAR